MMPPICEICSREFNPDVIGGLIYFRETKRGRDFERRVSEEKWIRHPLDSAWFCGIHSGEAKKLVNLTIDDALKTIKKNYIV